MLVPDPAVIEVGELDTAIAALPNTDAVFLVRAGDRSAYLAKTSMLRRRLLRILKPAGGGELDTGIAPLPNPDAVFLVRAGDRSAYLAKTSMLRRRLLRILKPAEGARRSLNLREVVTRVEF